MKSSADLGFGTRLRKERERRRITLSSIAANTKIGLSLLEGLERGDVARWPSGIFRRSFIKSYASAIGLDAEEVAREFLDRFPDPNEPERAAPVATTTPADAHASSGTTLRLKLVDSPTPFARGRLLAVPWRRWAAAAWDVATVIALGVVLFVVVGEFWMSVAVATIAYYVSSIVVLGNTPGVSFFAAGAADSSPPSSGSSDTVSDPVSALRQLVR